MCSLFCVFGASDRLTQLFYFFKGVKDDEIDDIKFYNKGIWQESKKKALVRSDNTTESIQCLEKYKKWLGFIDSFKVKVYSNVNNR